MNHLNKVLIIGRCTFIMGPITSEDADRGDAIIEVDCSIKDLPCVTSVWIPGALARRVHLDKLMGRLVYIEGSLDGLDPAAFTVRATLITACTSTPNVGV